MTENTESFINITAYQFITIKADDLPVLRAQLKEKAVACALKGTILMSTEGINLFLSGKREPILEYQDFLKTQTPFKTLEYKESPSHHQPFTRMLVRIKKEIISMGKPDIQPEKETAPHIDPIEFKKWYENNKDMLVLDVRNDYEVELGTFKNAVDLNIETFRAFPDSIDLLPESVKEKPVVTFCTGGIRCEKAAELMRRRGFKKVYQLKGGIINYFEQCGGDFFEGECFVFDKRVAIDPQLKETQTRQCYSCRSPLTVDQQSEVCPHCEQAVNG